MGEQKNSEIGKHFVRGGVTLLTIGAVALVGNAIKSHATDLINHPSQDQKEQKPASEYGNETFQKLIKEAMEKKSNIMVPLNTFNQEIDTDAGFASGSISKLPQDSVVTVIEGPIGVGVVDEDGFYHEITRTSGINVFIQSIDSNKKSVNLGIQNLSQEKMQIKKQDGFNKDKFPSQTQINVYELDKPNTAFQVSYNKL